MINVKQKGDFILRARNAASKFIEAKEELDACLVQRTIEATDYAALTDDDFVGEDAGLRLKLLDLWTGVAYLDEKFPTNQMVVFYAVRN